MDRDEILESFGQPFYHLYDEALSLVKEQTNMKRVLNRQIENMGFTGLGAFINRIHDEAEQSFMERVWTVLSEPMWFTKYRCIRELRAARADLAKFKYLLKKWKRHVYLRSIGNIPS